MASSISDSHTTCERHFPTLLQVVFLDFNWVAQCIMHFHFVVFGAAYWLNECLWNPQIYKGDLRPCIPPRVMALSAMGLKLRAFGFLPTTHAKTNAKQMHPQSWCTVQCFMCVYLHAQTIVDAGDICMICTWLTVVILITGKTRRP